MEEEVARSLLIQYLQLLARRSQSDTTPSLEEFEKWRNCRDWPPLPLLPTPPPNPLSSQRLNRSRSGGQEDSYRINDRNLEWIVKNLAEIITKQSSEESQRIPGCKLKWAEKSLKNPTKMFQNRWKTGKSQTCPRDTKHPRDKKNPSQESHGGRALVEESKNWRNYGSFSFSIFFFFFLIVSVVSSFLISFQRRAAQSRSPTSTSHRFVNYDN